MIAAERTQHGQSKLYEIRMRLEIHTMSRLVALAIHAVRQFTDARRDKRKQGYTMAI
ncbi:hypothetical protein D3C71_1691440 [compost metagenome]